MRQQIEPIDEKLETFLQHYNQGHRASSELIQKESLQVRQHVTAESAKTELAIRHVSHEVMRSEARVSKGVAEGIASLKTDEASRVSRERLLASLKYPGMNERRNQVTSSFPSTFDWIFVANGDQRRPGTPDDDSVSGSSSASDSGGKRDTDAENSESSSASSAPDSSEDDDTASTDTDSTEGQAPPDISWDCFSDWLRSEETIYWISGKPGSGKTTLVKHIIDHRLTQSCLDAWRNDPVVISHFFWRPGTTMQQNVKGMLSSLMYQLLEAQPILADAVLSNVHDTPSKDTETDWSIQSLRDVLVFVMKIDQQPLCIFLDGIDEMHPDTGIDDLLDLMARWQQSRNIPMKFCLASRPELPIRRRLASCPHLRLEDLTASDLTHYAERQLEFLKGDMTYEAREDYDFSIASLVQKAEGVFLWLCLAVKDLKRGFENGDEPKHLRMRVERLHSDIESLYEDMWSRMNGDEDIYRETTALYLKLMITTQGTDVDLTAFDMLLCSSEIADNVLDGGNRSCSMSTDKLLASLKRTEQQVLAKCAGLVETSDADDKGEVQVSTWDGEQHTCLSEYICDKRFRFIHRTAFHFLVDTVQGQKILSYDKNCEMDLRFRIIKAGLALRKMFCLSNDLSNKAAANGLIDRMPESPQHPNLQSPHSPNLQLALIEQMTYPEWIDENSEDCSQMEAQGSSWQRRLWFHCQQLYESGKLFYPTKPTTLRAFDDKNWELVYYAAFGVLDSYIHFEMTTRELSQSLKSQILINSIWVPGSYPYNDATRRSIRTLVDLGANPNMASSDWPEQSGFYRVETPWTLLLGDALNDHSTWMDLRYDNDSMLEETIGAFVKHDADPEAKVYLHFSFLQRLHCGNAQLRLSALSLARRGARDFPFNDFRRDRVWCGILALDALSAVEQICRIWPKISAVGVNGLVDDLRRRARRTPRSKMRVVALMGRESNNLFFADSIPFKVPSREDSDSLLEMLFATWPRDDTVDDEAFASRCQHIFERSPHGGDDVYPYLEQLGYLTRKVYRGDNDIENPWKEHLV
jgi:hypothetical protein